MKYIVFILGLAFAALSAHGAEIPVLVSPMAPLQGETAVLKFLDKTLEIESASFDQKPVPFFSYRDFSMALLAISATKPAGRYLATVKFKNGQVFEHWIQVRSKRFSKIVLGIPEDLNLSPQGLINKVKEESINLEKILSVKTPEIFFKKPFGLPLVDNTKITNSFGTIHKTGDREIRHLGVDMGAPLGTPIGAMNDGVIRKTYFDTVYGNTVIIDHGQGIFSMYLHLNEIKTLEGSMVKKGEIIGTVGKTGYATGPHLHLSFKIGGVSVDPIAFVRVFR